MKNCRKDRYNRNDNPNRKGTQQLARFHMGKYSNGTNAGNGKYADEDTTFSLKFMVLSFADGPIDMLHWCKGIDRDTRKDRTQ